MAFFSASELSAGYTFKDGWFVDTADLATLSLDEHYNLGAQAMQCQRWSDAANQFRIVTLNFPNSPLGQESYFWLGVAYYNLKELDFANDAFSSYLRAQNTPQYFEETIYYKYDIADQFRCGAKKRLFGTKQLPKWAPAYALAIEIFDEVIAAVPCHDLAAKALYIKGYLLWQDNDFRGSVDVFVQLIRRFPKHELAPESYLSITNIYLEQSQIEFQNPDLLGLAEINVRRFEQDFPGDEKVEQARINLQTIKETYARGLFETGQFYERTDKPWAAVIYYKRATAQFPDTNIAQCCYRRLNTLWKYNTVVTPMDECEQDKAIEQENAIDEDLS